MALYGEAKRERFLRELAELEGSVQLARSEARDKLDKYAAVQQLVGGAPGYRGAQGPPGQRVCPAAP